MPKGDIVVRHPAVSDMPGCTNTSVPSPNPYLRCGEVTTDETTCKPIYPIASSVVSVSKNKDVYYALRLDAVTFVWSATLTRRPRSITNEGDVFNC